jgi:hypothetical protein
MISRTSQSWPEGVAIKLDKQSRFAPRGNKVLVLKPNASRAHPETPIEHWRGYCPTCGVIVLRHVNWIDRLGTTAACDCVEAQHANR